MKKYGIRYFFNLFFNEFGVFRTTLHQIDLLQLHQR